MLAGLALTAATIVTLSSDALARGGFGGMRSFSVARAPTVVRTTSASAVHRTSATSHSNSAGTKTSPTKTHGCKKDCTKPGSSDHRHKAPFNWLPPSPASGSQLSSDGGNQSTAQTSVGDVRDHRNVEARDRRKVGVRDHRKDEVRDDRDGDSEDSESSTPKDSTPKDSGGQGGSGRDVVVNDGGGTRAAVYPVATLPSGPNQGSGGNSGGDGGTGTGTTGTRGSDGTISKENPIRPNPLPPMSAGTRAAPAPAAVDPPGCVYERSVQKLPSGGLQRVIFKTCPDA